MYISIVIITYCRDESLLKLLEKLNLEINFNVEILLLNNNCYDLLNKINLIITNEKIDLKYIWHQKNYGVSVGRDICITNSSSEYIILLDDDAYPESVNDLLTKTALYFEQNLDVGAIGFKIQSPDGLIRNHEIPHCDKNIVFKCNEILPTYYFIGAGHALNKSIYNNVGKYSHRMGLYGMEELDLSFRMINAGYKVVFFNNEIVLHEAESSGRLDNNVVTFNMFVNRVSIAARYLKIRYIVSALFIWGWVYLISSKSLVGLIKGLRIIAEEYKLHRKPFSNQFYKKMSKLNARLIY